MKAKQIVILSVITRKKNFKYEYIMITRFDQP